ncbi:MAG: gliding motility-associated ABC transporter permease subunit GldF [Gemmatales bacterium]|nr:MAG: gliding motility-associated ABC transporter permease subunit GldF [Gemmatales bacterium]
MLATINLIRREFNAYFLSPIAYVVLSVFLAVTGCFFALIVSNLNTNGPHGIEFPLRFMLDNWIFWLVYLFIPPLLTMRLFAEELSTGTLEMLMTSPIRDWQVVLSKYAACLAFYIVMWLPTFVFLPVICRAEVLDSSGNVVSLDPRPIWSSYLGLLLAGAMFLALGLLVSSLVRSQMVSALLSLVLSLIFVATGMLPLEDTGSPLYRVLYFLGVPLHFSRDFSRGIIDTRHLVLYVSVTLLCLFLTVRSLESRRWR